MNTMQLFHEYMHAPLWVIQQMRFGQWLRAKQVCEGTMSAAQALEMTMREERRIRAMDNK